MTIWHIWVAAGKWVDHEKLEQQGQLDDNSHQSFKHLPLMYAGAPHACRGLKVDGIAQLYVYTAKNPKHTFSKFLLSILNVIITTWPHTAIPSDCQKSDHNSDAIGFSQE